MKCDICKKEMKNEYHIDLRFKKYMGYFYATKKRTRIHGHYKCLKVLYRTLEGQVRDMKNLEKWINSLMEGVKR